MKAEALREAGIAPELAEEWLAIDRSFERALVKNSPEECEKRHAADRILVIPKPPN